MIASDLHEQGEGHQLGGPASQIQQVQPGIRDSMQWDAGNEG